MLHCRNGLDANKIDEGVTSIFIRFLSRLFGHWSFNLFHSVECDRDVGDDSHYLLAIIGKTRNYFYVGRPTTCVVYQ
jgi:hypothetical protein